MASVAYSLRFPHALSPPPDDDAALEHDILRQTRATSRLRLSRGRLGAALLTNKSWSVLGYARVGDYCRERIGIAGRTLEEDARVARALEHLPHLTSAFLETQLSWTQVCLLTTVATPATELQWITTALGIDTRSLARKIRTRTHPSKDLALPAGINSQRGPYTDDAEDADGVCDRCDRCDPRDPRDPDAQDARDRRDSEDTQHADDPTVRFSVRISRNGRRLWRAACEMAERTAGSALHHAQVLELITAEAASAAPRPESAPENSTPPFTRGQQNEVMQPGNPASDGKPRTHPARRNGWAGTPSGVHTFDLDEWDRPCGNDPFDLDAKLRKIERAMQRIDASVSPLLHRALAQRTHRRFGFVRFADYVEERLGICARKAWTLIALERAALRHSGELATAYRDGRISSLAATALLPVMSSQFGAAWIERARAVTLRRLEDEVVWALDRRDATSVSDGFATAAPAPPPLDHDLQSDRLSILETGGVQMRAEGKPAHIAHEVDLTVFVPPEVASLAEDTILALRRGTESRGAAFERMVACALLEWMSAPPHRDPVFERDGWRCAVPGCRSRRNLHDHHVLFRSHGGDNSRDNRITVCAVHHLHGLHGGRIRAYGRAPASIFWEMPLERFLGDRRL